jgi:hypothetical protein
LRRIKNVLAIVRPRRKNFFVIYRRATRTTLSAPLRCKRSFCYVPSTSILFKKIIYQGWLAKLVHIASGAWVEERPVVEQLSSLQRCNPE